MSGGPVTFPPEQQREGRPDDPFGIWERIRTGFAGRGSRAGGGQGGSGISTEDMRARALALLRASLEDSGLTLTDDGQSHLDEAMGERLEFLRSRDVVGDAQVATPYPASAYAFEGIDPSLTGYEVTLFNIGRLSQLIQEEAQGEGTRVIDESFIQRIKGRICPLPPIC